MRVNPLIQRVLLIVLCVLVLLPNYQMNAAASNQVYKNRGDFAETIFANFDINKNSDSSNEPISTDNNNLIQNIPSPKDFISVTKSVYNSEIPEELTKIKALLLQRSSLKGYKQSSDYTPNRVDDLNREEIEKLVLAGASIVDVHWINLIVKDSRLTPMDILEIKKTGRYLGKTLRSE